LQDKMAIAKISLLDIDSIRKLLTISKHNLLSLADKLTAEDLQHLADYLEKLNQPQINQLVKFLLNNNSSIINNSDVMADITRSGDINTAIKFWETPKNITSTFNGILKVLAGTISWHLFLHRYGISFTMSLIVIPLLVLVFVFAILRYQLRKYFKPQNTQVNP
ncbi:MAG: hypothetical protein VKN72_24750, partial [Nostocales cyanobacterium 94392]|nr:hypothetical protein [Nostocales cyanobacterium 94392]